MTSNDHSIEDTPSRESMLRELYAVLAGDNSLSRCCAVRALGRLHADDERSVKYLISLLRDPDPDVRLDAASTLGQLKIKSAVGALVENLENDPEGDVRIQAVSALSEIQSEPAVEPLIRCFVEDGYPDLDLVVDDLEYNACWEVQTRALEALGKSGDQRVVGPLMEVLEDAGYGDLQDSGYRVLAQLNSTEAKQFLLRQLEKGEPQARRRAASALTSLGRTDGSQQELPADILGALTNALVDPEPSVRQYAARALGNTRNPLVAVSLVMLVNDPNLEVRKEVAEILGGMRAKELLERLHPMLREPRIEVKRQVAVILGGIGDAASVEPLSELLSTGHADLLYDVAAALGKIGASGPQKKLAELLGDESIHYTIRIEAARALGSILSNTEQNHPSDAAGDVADESRLVRKTLADAVFGDDPRIAHAALSSLVEIDPRQAAERLSVLLRDNRMPDLNDDVPGTTPEGATEVGSGTVPDALREMVKGHSAETSTLASILAAQPEGEAQPRPREASEEQSVPTPVDNSIRILAARLLGGMTDPGTSALNALLAACDEPDPELVRAAVEALGRIGDQRALPLLIGKLDAPQADIKLAAVDALGRFEQLAAAVDGLSRLLDDSDSFLRRRAAQALGTIGGSHAVKHLPQLLADTDRDVCRAALAAITSEVEDLELSDRIIELTFAFSGELRTEAAAALRRLCGFRGASGILDVLHDREREEYHWICIDSLAEMFAVPHETAEQHSA